MQNRKRDTDVQNRLLDSVGEGQGGMFWENTIETCILLSRVKQITSPDWIHQTSARAWCTGKTQRNRVEREVGGVIRMGNTLNPWLIHVNVWQKPLQYCKVISLQLIKINEKKKKDSLIQKYGKHFSPMLNKCSIFLMFSSGNHNLRGALWLNRLYPDVQQRWKKTPKLKHQETLEATRQI